MTTRILLGAICLGLIGAAPLRSEETGQIVRLEVEEARRLAQDKSGRLALDGLRTLSPEVAGELAKHGGWLSLDGLTEISAAAAAALGQHKGILHLNGLAGISTDAANALAAHQGELSLDGLTAISDETAGAFARHSGGRLKNAFPRHTAIDSRPFSRGYRALRGPMCAGVERGGLAGWIPGS